MAKKPTTPKTPKAVEAPTEAIEPIVEQPATQVPETVENVPNALPDALELIPVVTVEEAVQEEPEITPIEGTIVPILGTSEQSEDEDLSTDDEVYVLNGSNQPIPAFLCSKTYVHPQEVVEDVLYAIHLGGEVDFNNCRLQGLPYLLTLKIPTTKKESWEDGSEKLKDDECNLITSFSAPNWMVFLEQLMGAGKLGAVVAPQGVHFKPYIATLKLKKPMENGAGVSVSTDKPTYTFQELDKMNTRQLKIIGKWYGIEKGVRIDLIPAILKSQPQE